ncbi:MAG: prephenate dehydrogenase/arogenate dehydrogenase family protein [Acidimicrobiia bacterium]|nr:prephenate dehydrogenase/arogenate dehydrogenase family protein [Acidimicrobiia bacterium]
MDGRVADHCTGNRPEHLCRIGGASRLGPLIVIGAPPFERVGIIGLGLIGGSVALAARRCWPGLHITACDPAPVTREAVTQGAITAVVDRIEDLAACDLIVIATPVQTVPQILEVLALTGTRALVTDVSSTKRMVMDAASRARVTFAGGHPVAGSESSGLAAARADLFDGKPWLLVSANAGEALDAMLTTVTVALGAKPAWTDAVTHDRVMAHVSHAPQVVSTALMAASAEAVGPDGVAWSGSGFADMTRLASSSSDMWQGILSTNADFIAEALDGIAAKLPTSSQALMDTPAVRDLFERARAIKKG